MRTSDLGDRLRALRATAELSGRALDELAHLGSGHAAMIETGRRKNIERETARALARVLGCTVGWLLEGEGAEPSAEEVKAAVERARGVHAAGETIAPTGTAG